MPALASITSSTMNLDDLTRVLLIGSLVLLVAVAAVRLSVRSGLPSLLIYLGIGLALGNAGAGIQFDDASITRVLGYAALVLILAEGGLTTSWVNIKDSVAPAAVLSTLGVVVSVLVVAVAAHTLLPLSWTISLLMGAIVTLDRRGGRLRRPAQRAAAQAAVRACSRPSPASTTPRSSSSSSPSRPRACPAARPTRGGCSCCTPRSSSPAARSSGSPWLARRPGAAPRRRRRPPRLFSIGVVALTVLAYAVGAAAARLRLPRDLPRGARPRQHGPAQPGRRSRASPTRSAGSPRSGSSCCSACSPTRRGSASSSCPAIVIGLVLLLVARPLSVVPRCRGSGCRGATRPSSRGRGCAEPCRSCSRPCRSSSGTPDTEWIFDLVFMLVVVFTIVQAPTLPWVARRLGLTEQVHSVDVDLESTTLMEIGADVIQVTVGRRVAAARRRRLRAAPAQGRQRHPRRARRRGVRARAAHDDPPRRPAARRHDLEGQAAHRAAHPRDQPRRAPRRLAVD